MAGIKKWLEKPRQMLDETSRLNKIKRRRDHNSSIPIAMLPPEILLNIISLTGPSKWDSYSDASKNIRVCSQVCHSWRSMSLSNPLLWSSCFSWLDLLSGEWTQELLRRSGFNSPLSVDVWLTNKPVSKSGTSQHANSPKANIELLSQRDGQVKNLQIRVDHDYAFKNFEEAFLPFCRSAPSLSSFTLSSAGRRYGTSYYFILDTQAFGGKACPLKHLTLRNCALDLKSPLYRQLTSLDIFYIGDDPRAPTAAEWLAVVETCKSLVHWSLEGFISTPKSTADLHEVSLPSLAYLRLHLYCPDAITFLSHLRFPSLHSFDVIVSGINPQLSDDLQTLSHVLKYHIDTFLPSLKPSPWSVSFIDTDSIRLSKEQRSDIPERGTFSIEYGIWPEKCLDEFAIPSLLSMLLPHGMAQTEELTIHIHHPTDPKIPPDNRLLAALSVLASVTTLRLAYYKANTRFFSARTAFWTPYCPGPKENLLDCPNSFLATPRHPCLFPRLSCLIIQPITPVESLKTFISQRKTLGASIQTVRFCDRDGDVIHSRSELPSQKQFEELRNLGLTIIIDEDIQEVLATTDAIITREKSSSLSYV